ncbi:deoxynucleoside kinase [Xenorhabdus stockiae]|uniref:Deoxynucleoside kinase n=1 Tax=Xenorhabdus stockiae TaxID=351614 RepID=A0A2D0KP90_9GAMM|nr:deoxynucleoside kinase [Xenorhabdus stockiae]PHM65249.1 deoxynucleoside kinase [Xenorhabdus stockiae]
MDEKQLQAPATELTKNLKNARRFKSALPFPQKLTVETLIISWIAKGFNLVMERSHLEDYIFINFMLKTGYINESHHRAYMQLWEEINHIIPVPDLIVFLNYSAEHSLQHLHADETHGIRPKEFPDEVTKIKWIKGWHDEYQYFLNSLPENLRSRVMVCQGPDNINEFSDIVINKINMLRR